MRRLPRFMNRGLIEVPRGGSPRAGWGPLPRFMNRGLIEVATPVFRLVGWQDFPDS